MVELVIVLAEHKYYETTEMNIKQGVTKKKTY